MSIGAQGGGEPFSAAGLIDVALGALDARTPGWTYGYTPLVGVLRPVVEG
jgi:hypothetical protein